MTDVVMYKMESVYFTVWRCVEVVQVCIDMFAAWGLGDHGIYYCSMYN